MSSDVGAFAPRKSLWQSLQLRWRAWRRRYSLSPRQTSYARLALAVFCLVVAKVLLFDHKPSAPAGQIQHQAFLERLTQNAPLIGSPRLDARKFDFLRSRAGRDERPDLFIGDIKAGVTEFWQGYQLPFATSHETVHLDEQIIKGAVEELSGFNGWVTASCSVLTRPFSKTHDDAYTELTSHGQLYFFGLVVSSADHFVIDQLAVVVQLARRLGPSNIFVSILDYASSDATPFLCDLTEMVLVLLGIPFRIRRVGPMTDNPAAAYYPSEEAYTRNLVLEPLHELKQRRGTTFTRVIWLKGFVCPADILESLRISVVNRAAMTCSMDWKKQGDAFLFNDRWRTRDLDGNLFQASNSTAPAEDAPPREEAAVARYGQHLPFQVFCCESGSHIVDPARSYYAGVAYRAATDGIFNQAHTEEDEEDQPLPARSGGPCMDSAQMHFCRDLWLLSARQHVDAVDLRVKMEERNRRPRNVTEGWEAVLRDVVLWQTTVDHTVVKRRGWNGEVLQNDGSAVEAAPGADVQSAQGESPSGGQGNAAGALPSTNEAPQQEALDPVPPIPTQRQPGMTKRDAADPPSIPNSEFPPARILINPRCVTTYADVSHTQLAIDLFGAAAGEQDGAGERYALAAGEWQAAPETFVCQEMRTTGGRTASKAQRRTGFSISRALRSGWHPSRQ